MIALLSTLAGMLGGHLYAVNSTTYTWLGIYPLGVYSEWVSLGCIVAGVTVGIAGQHVTTTVRRVPVAAGGTAQKT